MIVSRLLANPYAREKSLGSEFQHRNDPKRVLAKTGGVLAPGLEGTPRRPELLVKTR